MPACGVNQTGPGCLGTVNDAMVAQELPVRTPSGPSVTAASPGPRTAVSERLRQPEVDDQT